MKLYDKLNKKPDLTRWNRAGLKQFRYIDRNAISYLESIRQELVEQYDNGGSAQWNELLTRFPESPNETPYQSRKRLNGQYYDDRRDYAWEILRTFSRSAHILGEYIDAYANEAYLPTAVEWDNIRKLVAMLDYSPSPPASAETHIALLFKKNEEGEVDKGFAVKNKPRKGESTAIFETQEKLEGSASVNQLHLKDWSKNFRPLKSHKSKGLSDFELKKGLNPITVRFYLADDTTDEINVGDEGVIATPTQGFPIQVLEISNDDKGKFLILKSTKEQQFKDFKLFNTTLYLQPDFVSSPLPNGSGSIELTETNKFTEGDVVFTGKGKSFEPQRIEKSELGFLQLENLDKSVKPGENILRAHKMESQILDKPLLASDSATKKVFVFPKDIVENDILTITNERLEEIPKANIKKETVHQVDFWFITDNGSYGEKLYYIDDASLSGSENQSPSVQNLISKVGVSSVEEISFSGKSTDLESGQWCLVNHKKGKKSEGTNKAAYLISQINAEEETFSVTLKNTNRPVALLRSAFKLALKHKNHDVNQSSAAHADSTRNITILELENTSAAEDFELGQKIICASDSNAVTAKIKDIVGAKLYLSPVFHNEKGFTRNNTLIYGNVVRATHGETQAEKIVGNGDASQTNQCFELTSDSISWVADATFSSGVRADLSLRVGQRAWQQVQDLFLSAPEDHHYMVTVNQDNMLKVCFGDGRHGRRLPTGLDNVRVRFRNGYGEAGNLEANALVKISRPHSLVEGFIAPLSAIGGAEKESSESMRESAPATVLALSRAVSIDDFTHLAAQHSMVWQAKALEKIPDRPARSQIEVVIVAAGGTTFQDTSDTATLIQNFLVSHSAPGTPISVVSYRPLFLHLKLFVMVDEAAYEQKQVELAVRDHLEAELILNNRKLGQSLFRSEIIALLEQVEGVENGHCEILAGPYQSLASNEKPRLFEGDDGEIRKLGIQADQLLYLDSKRYPLQINSLEYEI